MSYFPADHSFPALPADMAATAGYTCPIELLPVGTEVLIRDIDRRTGRRMVRKVGTPVYVKGEYISGKYRDCINAWDYVMRGTTFEVVHVPSGKPVPAAWVKAAAEGL